MSRKKIVMLLTLGVVIATTVVLAMYAPAQAQSYGATAGATTGSAKTGAELGLFAVAGAGLLGAGYFLTRKSKA